MVKQLGAGEHLVKVTSCDSDLIGDENGAYCLINFRGSNGTFSWKIYARDGSWSELQDFFNAVDIWHYNDSVLILLILQKSINSYLIITLSQSENGLYISNCKHPSEIYDYCILFPPFISLSNENMMLFKFCLSNRDGDEIGDVGVEAITKRKYFLSFESAEKYLMREYTNIARNPSYKGENRILFKTSRNLRLNERVLISVLGNSISYYNELDHRNREPYPYQIEVYGLDTFGDVTEYTLDFKTEEAARNFIENFDGDNGDNRSPSYIRMNYLHGKITDEHRSSLDSSDAAREAFDAKYFNMIFDTSSRSDQDLLDIAFEGDPENLWNID